MGWQWDPRNGSLTEIHDIQEEVHMNLESENITLKGTPDESKQKTSVTWIWQKSHNYLFRQTNMSYENGSKLQELNKWENKKNLVMHDEHFVEVMGEFTHIDAHTRR